MQGELSKENIRVTVRIRPKNEKEANFQSILKNDTKTIYLENCNKSYTFDQIAGPLTSQTELFDLVAKPIALPFLEGYNSCIFAYGQTGTGKTFTILGPVSDDLENFPQRGLIPRTIQFIFDFINTKKSLNSNIDYFVKCSFLEIYNEHIIDLVFIINFNLCF